MAEILQILLMVAITVLVLKAAIKTYKQSNELRGCDSYSKTIYNYNNKTQSQIFSILQLEVQHELPNREILKFSEPIFKKDGSAEYVVYLKKEEK